MNQVMPSENWHFCTMHPEPPLLRQKLNVSCGCLIETPSIILLRMQLRKINVIINYSRKREKYEDFLKSVKVLQNMDHYERSKLADAIKEERYEPNEYVIREGEPGNSFFMIIEGEAIATKTLEPGHPPKEVMKYKPGDYFGELALLKNEPRAANVVATHRLKVVSLERNSFKRLLGPLDDILKRNMDAYLNYL